MLRVKICGITNIDDLEICISEKVDEVGFIFYEKSKRFIKPEKVSEMLKYVDINKTGVSSVAVFVNESIDTVLNYAGITGVDMVQLHGYESTGYCKELLEKNGPCFKVIKAFPVSGKSDIENAVNYMSELNSSGLSIIPLFDTKTKEYGGCGKVFDWNLLSVYQDQIGQYYLSGGLNIKNISAALNILDPYTVDISSGVEDKPGIKNKEKINSFLKHVRSMNL